MAQSLTFHKLPSLTCQLKFCCGQAITVVSNRSAKLPSCQSFQVVFWREIKNSTRSSDASLLARLTKRRPASGLQKRLARNESRSNGYLHSEQNAGFWDGEKKQLNRAQPNNEVCGIVAEQGSYELVLKLFSVWVSTVLPLQFGIFFHWDCYAHGQRLLAGHKYYCHLGQNPRAYQGVSEAMRLCKIMWLWLIM